MVRHRPVSTPDARQRKLSGELLTKYPGQLIHVPVWINKDQRFGREPTQRSRSFLFAALGTLAAQSLGAHGIRFRENGVLTVNLPLAEEALRARASRTTHPVTLHLTSQLSAAVTGRELRIDNPFLLKTKAEVVQILAKHEQTDLIALSCSCSHLMFQSSKTRHCGQCSQCIDRRFAVAGAGLLSKDPETDYASDVFIGARVKELDRSIAIDSAVSKWKPPSMLPARANGSPTLDSSSSFVRYPSPINSTPSEIRSAIEARFSHIHFKVAECDLKPFSSSRIS